VFHAILFCLILISVFDFFVFVFICILILLFLWLKPPPFSCHELLFGFLFSYLMRLQGTALAWPALANSYPPSSTSPSFLQSVSTALPPPA
jgi:hypothetical protein